MKEIPRSRMIAICSECGSRKEVSWMPCEICNPQCQDEPLAFANPVVAASAEEFTPFTSFAA